MGAEVPVAEQRSYPPSVQPGIPRLTVSPDGWGVERIGDLLAPVSRRVHARDNEEYLLVTARRNRGGLVERERKLGRDILTKTQFRAEADDFVISRRQIAHGACGLLPHDLDGALVSNEYSTLRPTSKLDLNFLRHLPHSIYFQQTCFHSSIGVHVEKLVFDLENWLTWPINTPPLREQRRIAAVLDAWDEAIALNERLVTAKRRRRDGVRQELLAPAFNAKMRSEGWSRMSITDVADIRGGGTPSSGEPGYWNGDVAWCTPTDLTGLSTRFLRSTAKNITQQGLKASAASVLPAGSIILCSRASVGECAISTIPMATNQGFQSLIPHHAEDAPFLYHLMRHAKSQLLRISAGSTFLEFGRSELRRMKVALPDPITRAKIGLTLDAMTDEIDLLAARTDLLRTQKRGLMQRLLTGAARVPETLDALMPGSAPREAAE